MFDILKYTYLGRKKKGRRKGESKVKEKGKKKKKRCYFLQ
jgi:hypothetical protein